MKLAVIKTGGKQYTVAPQDKLKVEKLPGNEGDSLLFDQILLVSDGKEVKIGMPVLGEHNVTAKILKQGRARKVNVVKYKAKVRYKKTHGHRQNFTEVEIEKIG